MNADDEYSRYCFNGGKYWTDPPKTRKDKANDRVFDNWCRIARRSMFGVKSTTERQKDRELSVFFGLDCVEDIIATQDKVWSQTEPGRKIAKSISQRVRRHINSDTTKADELLGCDPDTMRRHIEGQFTDGMGWDNWGEWHLDHIIPVCVYDLDNEHDLYSCCNYRNLRPIWADENLEKGGVLVDEFVVQHGIEDLLPEDLTGVL